MAQASKQASKQAKNCASDFAQVNNFLALLLNKTRWLPSTSGFFIA